MIDLKRAYEPASPSDGTRILVDRLWPRGISKTRLHADAWMKQIAPSDRLRQWFGHDPAKWNDFRRKYQAELRGHAQDLQPLLDAARRGHVTLLYSAHDPEHNNAVALREVLQRRLQSRQPRSTRTTRTPSARRNPRT